MIIGAVAVGSLVAFSANAYLAFDAPGGVGIGGNSGANIVMGQEFIVNQAVTITALGAFDAAQDGWGASDSAQVAIYNFNTHAQVSPVVTLNAANPGTINLNSDSAYGGASLYRFQAVTSFNLNPGTYEIVASCTGSGANYQFYDAYGFGAPVANNTGGGLLTFGDGSGGAGNYLANGGLAFPGNLDGGPIGRYGAGSFSFTPVPEATAFGAAGVGLLALVYLGRCARRMKVA